MIRTPARTLLPFVLLLAVAGGCAPESASTPENAAPGEGESAPDPKTQARLRMAYTLLDEGQIDAGLEQLRRLPDAPAVQSGPAHPPPWLEPVVERLLRRRAVEEADSLLRMTGPIATRSPRLQVLTANLQVLEGEVEAAIGTYAAIRSDDPELQVKVLHELASLELARGEAAAALERAREGLALVPGHQPLKLLASQALRRLDRPREALAELATMNPAPARWVAEAELHLDVFDRPDTAVTLMLRATRSVPQDLHFRQTLGRAQLAAGQFERAVQSLEPLAKLPTPFEQSQELLARARRARGDVAAADSLDAIVQAKRRADEVGALRVEGLRFSYDGEHERALERFDAALALAPSDGDLHNDRGTALANLERWAAAERAFRRAAELRPQDPTPMENLARLYDRTGDVEQRDRALAEAQERRSALAESTATPR